MCAAAAIFAGPRNIDGQGTTIQQRAIESTDRLLGFVTGTHRNETEAAWPPAFTLNHQAGFSDGSVRRKGVVKCVFGRVEREVPDVKFVVHSIIRRPGGILLPDCSRTSGFESSLNEVHLKIYQAVER